MNNYQNTQLELRNNPRTWLVTGAAGFIGSNLVEKLLSLDQIVVGLDNFSTGYQRNLDEVRSSISDQQRSRFSFINGDICSLEDCRIAVAFPGYSVDFVLHQAALGSVPRSIADPIATNRANVDGFLNMLIASRDAKVRRFVYAASSSTYGDHPALPKMENTIGRPLSPYAVTKYINELYANVFARVYGLPSIGLRYFNVFGKRQDPNGAYAAVIPKWTFAMLAGTNVSINGDGETSRDFCYIDNAVQANLLAAVAEGVALNEVYNIALNARTNLNQLYAKLKEILTKNGLSCNGRLEYREFREGDVRHSQADISKARRLLGYDPLFDVQEGLEQAVPWYISSMRAR